MEINKLYCMDNLELLKQIPDESIDLIYSDILYNTGKKFKDYDDNLGTPQEAIEWYKPRFKEMIRILKPNGTILIHCDINLVHYIKVYMDTIKELNFKNDIRYIKQTRDMEDKDKDKFLSFFELDPSKTTVGFAVLGGIFSEGIDFYSDKLIGAIVVGVGIPQISFERDLIKEHFDSEEINGYEYAYVNPGITKIIQAAGRVIRSENDKGIIVFIDDRFTQYKYRNILKKQYKNNEFVNNERQIDYLLEQFWKKNK